VIPFHGGSLKPILTEWQEEKEKEGKDTLTFDLQRGVMDSPEKKK